MTTRSFKSLSILKIGWQTKYWFMWQQIVMWVYVVCSKCIANFEFLPITYIRFWIFYGVILVFKSLTYADKFGHFECSVNFWQLFWLDVFRLVFDFCLFQKNGAENLYKIFRVERSIRNITCKLWEISAKQSARNARICERTKIAFRTMITPLCLHIVACVRIFPQKQHNNVAAVTVFPRSGPLWLSCSRIWRGKNRRRAKRRPSKIAVKN